MVPRQILPGSTYLVSRRCTQRQFLLAPKPQTTAIFGYCLAVAAARYNIQVHAACVMSNHWHAVVTDPDARIPAFLAYLHKYVAKAVNALLKRRENLWSTAQPSFVRLFAPEDVLAKIVYVVTNPVAASLVPRAELWPGLLRYLPRHSKTFARPETFFRKDGPMPAEAALKLTVAPALADLGADELERRVQNLVRSEENRFERERRASKRTCLGLERLRNQRPTDQPGSPEPRHQLIPKLAAREKERRLEALQLLRNFVAAYRKAWTRWHEGVRGVLFPAGTYALKVLAGVRCRKAET